MTELPEIPAENILKKIYINLNSKNITNILLCTDDIKYLNLLKKEFGEIVKFNYNNYISHDGYPLHFTENRKIINKQVLSDVYFISKSKHFLYCYSNVSHLALTIGAKNFETIEVLN